MADLIQSISKSLDSGLATSLGLLAFLWLIFSDWVKEAIKKVLGPTASDWLAAQLKEHGLFIVFVVLCLAAVKVIPPTRAPMIALALLVPVAIYVIAQLLIKTQPADTAVGKYSVPFRMLLAVLCPVILSVAITYDKLTPLDKLPVSIILPPSKKTAVDDDVAKSTYNTILSALKGGWTNSVAVKDVTPWDDLMDLAGADGPFIEGKLKARLEPNAVPQVVAQPLLTGEGKGAFVLAAKLIFRNEDKLSRMIYIAPFRYPVAWGVFAAQLTAARVAEEVNDGKLTPKQEGEIANNLLAKIRAELEGAVQLARPGDQAGECLARYLNSLPADCTNLACTTRIATDLTPLVNALEVDSDGIVGKTLSMQFGTVFKDWSARTCKYENE